MKSHYLSALSLWLVPVCVSLLFSSFAAAAAGQEYWVYFGTYTGPQSKGIYVSRMDADGKLSAPELAATTDNPTFIAMDAQHRFLYAANEVDTFQGKSAGAVSAFAVDAKTGKLSPLNQQTSGGPGPCCVSVDPSGKVVLVANYGGGSISSYPVMQNGGLGAPASFIQHHGSSVNPDRQTKPYAHCIITDPAGRLALVCDLGMDKVMLYKLNPATAVLTPSDPPFATLAPGAGPRHVTFHPNGKFAYVVTEMGLTVTAFQYDAAASTLTTIQTISTLPASIPAQTNFTAAEIIVHPSGKFLYTSTRSQNNGANILTVFSIDPASGKLTFVDSVPSGGRIPRNFNIDPSGRFLLSANQNSNNVLVFNIDASNGRLTATGQQLQMSSPVCILFAPVQ